MAKTVTVKGKTANKARLAEGQAQGLKGEELQEYATIEYEFNTLVPESMEEAAGPDFFNGEDKCLAIVVDKWETYKSNAVRPVIRELENPDQVDIGVLSQNTADGYQPGRRATGAPEVSQSELAGADSMEQILAILAAKGVKLTS